MRYERVIKFLYSIKASEGVSDIVANHLDDNSYKVYKSLLKYAVEHEKTRINLGKAEISKLSGISKHLVDIAFIKLESLELIKEQQFRASETGRFRKGVLLIDNFYENYGYPDDDEQYESYMEEVIALVWRDPSSYPLYDSVYSPIHCGSEANYQIKDVLSNYYEKLDTEQTKRTSPSVDYVINKIRSKVEDDVFEKCVEKIQRMMSLDLSYLTNDVKNRVISELIENESWLTGEYNRLIFESAELISSNMTLEDKMEELQRTLIRSLGYK